VGTAEEEISFYLLTETVSETSDLEKKLMAVECPEIMFVRCGLLICEDDNVSEECSV
jgi:hypothetical protein